MIKIKILSVGKTQEPWMQQGLQMYTTRLSPHADFEYVWLKDVVQLEKEMAKEKHLVILDALGHTFESVQFSEWFFKEVEKGGSRLTFVIGPAEGLRAEIKAQAYCISLSSLTFTHQFIRLILLEQLFRAFEIRKGSSYHK